MAIVIKTAASKGKEHRTGKINRVNPQQGKGAKATDSWKDKEFQEDIKKRELKELLPMTFIEKSEIEMVDTLMKRYHEKAIGKKVVLTKSIKVAEMRSEAGIILDSDEFMGSHSAKHGQKVAEAQYPSHLAVVLSVGKDVGEIKRGDVVRFSPLSAAEVKFGKNFVWIVYETDVQTVAGSWTTSK